MSSKAYPNISAVDPAGCGCTECITGEYAPLDTWAMRAMPKDVIALIRGRVANNTFTDNPLRLVMDVHRGYESTSFHQRETTQFLNDLEDALYERVVRDAHLIDLKALIRKA